MELLTTLLSRFSSLFVVLFWIVHLTLMLPMTVQCLPFWMILIFRFSGAQSVLFLAAGWILVHAALLSFLLLFQAYISTSDSRLLQKSTKNLVYWWPSVTFVSVTIVLGLAHAASLVCVSVHVYHICSRCSSSG